MQTSQKFATAIALALAALAVVDFTIGVPSLRLNTDTGAIHAAGALCGFVCVYAGRRMSNLFLAGAGLLLFADAFQGATRGTFYLSFDALRGAVTPLDRPARFIAAAPHGIIGAVALVAGLMFANRDAKDDRRAPPT